MADLEAMVRAAKVATPGPWFSSGTAVTTDFDIGECGLLVADCEARIDEEAHSNVAANADFIEAWNPTAALEVATELAALRAENAELMKLNQKLVREVELWRGRVTEFEDDGK